MTVQTSTFIVTVDSMVPPNAIAANINYFSPCLRWELLPNRLVHSSAAKPAFSYPWHCVYLAVWRDRLSGPFKAAARHWQESGFFSSADSDFLQGGGIEGDEFAAPIWFVPEECRARVPVCGIALSRVESSRPPFTFCFRLQSVL